MPRKRSIHTEVFLGIIMAARTIAIGIGGQGHVVIVTKGHRSRLVRDHELYLIDHD